MSHPQRNQIQHVLVKMTGPADSKNETQVLCYVTVTYDGAVILKGWMTYLEYTELCKVIPMMDDPQTLDGISLFDWWADTAHKQMEYMRGHESHGR